MKNKLSLFTLIGLVLGIAFGLVCPTLTPTIKFIGTYYITILKYMVVPVVITTISVSIYNSTKLKNKLVPITLLVFVLMFSATFLLSSLLVTLINPSSGFVLENVDWSGTTTVPGVLGMLNNLIPRDIKKFLTGGYLFTAILISVIVGFVCSKINNGQKVIDVIEKIKEFLFKVLGYYMYVTPFAVFSLISNTIVEYGPIVLGVGAKYILTAYICAIAALIVVMILPILLITKMNPITFIKKVYKIWTITLSTCSSAATLPYTIKTCHEEFGIPDEVTDVVVPLGTTIHMCGGAVSFALLGLFCSKLFGVEITFGKYILMLIYAILINMAAPGIPNGGVAIGATYLQLLGIPLDFIGFYSGIYKLLDMIYTSLNVTDDIASNVIINYFNKKKIMNKILIIGCPGSGKSTFARRLRDKTNLPLFYLDMIYHRADKTTINDKEFDEKLNEILIKNKWIIDGNYSRTLETRIKECDTVFYFDLPNEDCIKGVENRIGTKREDMPWIEEEFDQEFRKWIEDFSKTNTPIIIELLEKYNNKINIIVFKNRIQADNYINNL